MGGDGGFGGGGGASGGSVGIGTAGGGGGAGGWGGGVAVATERAWVARAGSAAVAAASMAAAGSGAGGDIFVQQGGLLTIGAGNLAVGTVQGGPGYLSGDNGRAYGSSIFIQNGQTITLAPPAGQTLSIAGTIAMKPAQMPRMPAALRAGVVLLSRAAAPWSYPLPAIPTGRHLDCAKRDA